MNYIDSETAEYFRQSSDIYSSGCSLMKSVNLQANEAANSNTILRVSTMLYSMVCYLIGVVALVYLILFIADLFVPITINRGAGNSPELTGIAAVFWNISVVMIWGLQHTIMARPAFKRISFICDDFSPNKKHLELRCCTNWFGTR